MRKFKIVAKVLNLATKDHENLAVTVEALSEGAARIKASMEIKNNRKNFTLVSIKSVKCL